MPADDGDAPQRVRIVLADVSGSAEPAEMSRRPAARVRTEFDEQTSVGEVLVRGLVRAQLNLALRLAALVVLTLGALPALFALVPGFGSASVAGVRLPWLLLGVVAFPFLVVVGWVYTRSAERNERDFAELVERS